MTIAERRTLVDRYMRSYYGVGLDAMEISDVPGYWRDKEPHYHPGHPLHGCLFCEEPFRATYTYLDSGRLRNGQFVSPYRTWQILREKVTA